ncbi:MAG: glycoside hydrolase family 35 [Candidatus Lokiarchaeota archaeon]|nr:glycoside hydrolase family 35 [Candidatus Lokiarchaeota archaeon]
MKPATAITFKAPGKIPAATPHHLGMGGKSPAGMEIDVTSQYITIDGKPVLPVSGEMHFSRYPNQFWEEELLKMKACGITIIASYIFWIHHEEVKDEFDWTGDRDLRKFVQLCAKHGLLVFLRLGPFCHGECRNGGIPDWFWTSSAKRTTDPEFLARTRILYQEIAKQVRGLLFKDGGPVAMIQLENEMCAGEKGIPYMQALKRIAIEAGFDVPIYTATGWGDSSIPPGELIPTFGSYPDTPWDTNYKPYGTEHSKCFFFTPERDDGFIDNKAVVNDAGRSKYKHPYLTCETGPGIQITYSRRPIIQPADVLSLALIKVGNGANMIGYYVFHGGTHPVGKLTTMEENLGRPSMLIYPTFSYDFQAPLGEFGQVRPSYHGYRLLHLFLEAFGSRLAPMVPVLPEAYPMDLDDADTPRAGARVAGNAGFVFYNNHDRFNPRMHDIPGVSFKISLPGGTIAFPAQPVIFKKGTYGILPFNLDVHGVVLRYATAQPITMLGSEKECTLFFFQLDGMDPEFAFVEGTVDSVRLPAGSKAKIQRAGGQVILTGIKPGRDVQITAIAESGSAVHIVLLDAGDAGHFWKGHAWGQERAIIASTNLYFDSGDAVLYGEEACGATVSIFPPGGLALSAGGVGIDPATDGAFARFVLPRKKEAARIAVKAVHGKDDPGSWQLDIPKDALDGSQDLFLSIEYIGNSATLNVDGKDVADDFYSGVPWIVGIKRWAPRVLESGARLSITPLDAGDEIFLEKWPAAGKGAITMQKLVSISAWQESSVRVTNGSS